MKQLGQKCMILIGSVLSGIQWYLWSSLGVGVLNKGPKIMCIFMVQHCFRCVSSENASLKKMLRL